MRLHLMEAHGQSAEVPEEADAEESGSLSVVDSQSSVGSTVPAVDHAKQQALLNRRERYALLKRRQHWAGIFTLKNFMRNFRLKTEINCPC